MKPGLPPHSIFTILADISRLLMKWQGQFRNLTLPSYTERATRHSVPLLADTLLFNDPITRLSQSLYGAVKSNGST